MKLRKLLQLLSVVCALLMLTMTNQVLAEGLSDDNSLTSLGIQTDGVTVSPEFSFDIWNYDVTVPAGTTELSLSPELSNPTATINSVSGTTLNEDGSGRVVITVTAEDGSVIEYVLNVTAAQMPVDPAEAVAENEAALQEAVPAPETQPESAAAAPAAEAAPAPQAETPSPVPETALEAQEPQTEDSRFVKVDKNSLAEAENTIERLQQEMEVYKERIHLFTYVIYGLIGLSVVLLFLVINLILRRKDIARELSQYKKMGFDPSNDPSGMAGRSGHFVPEDKWLDDDEEWIDESESRKKSKDRKKKEVPGQQFGEPYLEETRNPETSWAETQIGTPVEPQRTRRAERSPRYVEEPAVTRRKGPAARPEKEKSQEIRVESLDLGSGIPEEAAPKKKMGGFFHFGKKREGQRDLEIDAPREKDREDASRRARMEEASGDHGQELTSQQDVPAQDFEISGSSERGVNDDTKLYSVRSSDAGNPSVPKGNTRVISLPEGTKVASSGSSGKKEKQEPSQGGKGGKSSQNSQGSQSSVEIDMIDL